MNVKNPIQPQWGVTCYHQRGCKSFEFQNPEMRFSHPRNQPFPPRLWRNITKNLRKIKPIPCYHCIHYHTTQCVYSHAFFLDREQNYRNQKPRCIYCTTKVQNFHEFLLKCQDTPFICSNCAKHKNLGTLIEELSKDLKLGFFSMAQIVFYVVFSFLPIIAAIYKWIIQGIPDYFSAIFGSSLFLFLLGMKSYFRKEKKRKT